MKNAMGDPGHILVVDDDLDTRDSIAESLEDKGYTVVCAGDGVEALEKLHAGPLPKLMLLDYTMPRMNGAELRVEMAKVPAWSAVPVVLLTADQNLERKAAELKVAAAMKKPVNASALFEVVARLFNGGAA